LLWHCSQHKLCALNISDRSERHSQICQPVELLARGVFLKFHREGVEPGRCGCAVFVNPIRRDSQPPPEISGAAQSRCGNRIIDIAKDCAVRRLAAFGGDLVNGASEHRHLARKI
jgi:hypothetical protein